MSEVETHETLHERRVTWGLMAAVFVFVLLMSCIVLWVTTSLIRNQQGAVIPPVPSVTAAPVTAAPTLTATPPADQPTATATARLEETTGPLQAEATWTVPPGRKRYVRFKYWYVRPNKVKLGECVKITWETEYATKLQLYKDDELFLDRAPSAATLEDCPDRLGYVVYRLIGWNVAEETNWVQLQVRVVEAP